MASVLPKGEDMTNDAVRAVYKLSYSCENSPERTSHVIPFAETVPCYQSSFGVALGRSTEVARETEVFHISLTAYIHRL